MKDSLTSFCVSGRHPGISRINQTRPGLYHLLRAYECSSACSNMLYQVNRSIEYSSQMRRKGSMNTLQLLQKLLQRNPCLWYLIRCCISKACLSAAGRLEPLHSQTSVSCHRLISIAGSSPSSNCHFRCNKNPFGAAFLSVTRTQRSKSISRTLCRCEHVPLCY